MNERIYVRMSKEEKEILKKKAQENGFSLSTYIRTVLFKCDIEVKKK